MKMGISNTEVADPLVNCEEAYRTLLTPRAVQFLSELVQEFDQKVTQVNNLFYLLFLLL